MNPISSAADLRQQAGASLIVSTTDGLAPAEAVAGSGFGAVFDLASLDGDNGFRLDGEETYDNFGRSATSAGDVNGDGFGDLVIGAQGAGDEQFGSSKGGAYVVFGHAGGFDATFNASQIDGRNGFFVQGAEFDALTGNHVGSAGDLNGDGFSDVVLGAEFANGDQSGSAYVVFGHAGGFRAEIDLGHLKKAEGFVIKGAHSNDTVGSAVASAGDLNGDGVDDLLVGAAGSSADGHFGGATYVIYGRESGLRNIDLARLKPAAGFEIVSDHGRLGASVSSAGDVNGDGVNDIIVGAGGGYVVFGRTDGFGTQLNVSDIDGSNGFALQRYDGISSVSGGGDVNGDGFDDILAGNFDASHGAASGENYVIFGHAGGFDADFDLTSLNGHNGFTISGGDAGSILGYSAVSAGDINGDGFDDLVVNAVEDFQSFYSVDAAYVIFGKASGFHASLDLSNLKGSDGFKIESFTTSHYQAGSISAADVNGDGLSDLIIGADSDSASGQMSGSTFVIFGKAPTTAVHYVGTDASQSLVGGELNDGLSGKGGDDMLWGHGGKDRLTGGTGNDTLIGGAGKDVLTGSAGNDVFQYRDLGDSTLKAHDTIKSIGSTDVVDLHMLDADAGTVGDQAFHMVSAFSDHAGELTIAFDGEQTLVQGDVDGDGAADLVIAIAGDHHDFANFLL